MKKPVIIPFLMAMLIAMSLFTFGAGAAKSEDYAQNIAKSCKFRASSNNSKLDLLYDRGTRKSYCSKKSGKQNIDIDFCGAEAGGIYIKWDAVPSEFSLFTDMGNGFENERLYSAQDIYYQQYIALEQGVKGVRLLTKDAGKNRLSIYELEVYEANKPLSDSVHVWQPTPSSADLMVVSTHQDDEMLFFGGTIPYYGKELGYDTMVVYITYTNTVRFHEALNGLWKCGVKQYPVFLNHTDMRVEHLDSAKEYWDEDEVVADLARLMSKHRPQVVVTHARNGEYGNGQHMLASYCVTDAVEKVADGSYAKSLGKGYEAWKVDKCYLHLYKENSIVIPWDEMTMESMEGITAHKAATLGYLEHKTQQGLSFQVRCYGSFDSRKYGLYSSNVGADVKKNDFFENVVPRTVRCDVPQDAVYTGMTEVYKQSGIYSYTHSFSGELCYARYCQFEGNKDWYACDYTGGLGTQPQKLSYFIDADAGNISQYNGISVSSKWDKVFTYNNGEEIMLRYGSLNGSDNGWYPASGESFDVACDAQPIFLDSAEISQDTKESKDKYDFAKISPLEISILSAMGIVLISLIIMVASLYRRSKR